MSVSNGQLANQTTFNAAFLSRTASSDTVGILGLANVASASGSSVTNVQREHNSAASYIGKALNGIKNLLPAWTSVAVGAPTDDLTQRCEALTAAFEAFDLDQSFQGIKTFIDGVILQDRVEYAQADDATAGTGITLTNPATRVVRMTNAALVSIAGLGLNSPIGVQAVAIINATGNTITIVDDATATAAERIMTGQSGNIFLEDNGTIDLLYDTTEQRWRVVGGTGSGTSEDIIDSSEDLFNGDGVEDEFTLSADPLAEENIDVYVSGVRQEQTSWSLSGTTLTFSEAPPSGTGNIAVKIHRTIPLYGLPAASVTDAMRLLNYDISDSNSGSYTTTSTSSGLVTNMEVTIVASGTKPIELMLVPDGAGACVGVFDAANTSATGYLLYEVNGVENAGNYIQMYQAGASGDQEQLIPPGAVKWVLATPSAGSKTYKLRASVAAGTTLKVTNCKLYVKEA